ncbi:E3 ubiquitin-protein ligase listerin-like [Choristoneura fumiferana]|uniref:E3 ubiquitin-protein ligase listerin-like n=1 Tax=Choristoneura fumiferana TaxID=7141 RepID=UPI003D15D8F2
MAQPCANGSASHLNGDADRNGALPAPAQRMSQTDQEIVRLIGQHLLSIGLEVGEETCSMVPFTDSHSVALGYLLLADAVCVTATLARSDLVHHYLELFREGRHAEELASLALRLLPPAVAAHALDTSAPAHCTHMFLTPPALSLDEPSSSLDVGVLACRALYHCARWAGGALRGWWGAAPPRQARALERLLRAHVSPALVRDQLQAVAAAALPDAEVTVHPSTNEVVCTFVVEERPMELSVSLGAAHPLAPPRVAAAAPAPAPNTHWLAVYLAYQVTAILYVSTKLLDLHNH